ncbi:hypothetical protein FQZ97_597310 [compost metagenome]
MSVAAVVVMACSGAIVIYTLSGRLRFGLHDWPMVGLLAVFAVAVWRCGGNLASVLDYPRRWKGSERRRAGH